MHAVEQAPNFLDQKEPAFKKLRGTMDSRFRKLRQKGVGADVKHAGVFTSQEENLSWERGVLGAHGPFALLRTVFH